jgi:hypothetical protein
MTSLVHNAPNVATPSDRVRGSLAARSTQALTCAANNALALLSRLRPACRFSASDQVSATATLSSLEERSQPSESPCVISSTRWSICAILGRVRVTALRSGGPLLAATCCEVVGGDVGAACRVSWLQADATHSTDAIPRSQRHIPGGSIDSNDARSAAWGGRREKVRGRRQVGRAIRRPDGACSRCSALRHGVARAGEVWHIGVSRARRFSLPLDGGGGREAAGGGACANDEGDASGGSGGKFGGPHPLSHRAIAR